MPGILTNIVRRGPAPRNERLVDGSAARDVASLAATLRKLEWVKHRADAELAFADKALAAAKTDQAKARAEERRQKAASRVAEAEMQLDTTTADAKSKLDADAAAKDAVKAAETKKAAAANAANETKLSLEPVSIFISRATQKLYVRRNTHKRWPDGGEVFDASRGSGHNPASRQTDRHARAHRDGAQGNGAALDRGHDRQWG